MSLTNNLLAIYPDLDLLTDVRVRDDGNGSYIERWDDPRPQPSPSEIEEAVIPSERIILVDSVNLIASDKISSIFSLPSNSNELLIKQLNASARVAELQDIQINGNPLTTEEQVEMDTIRAVWDKIKSIRSKGAELKKLISISDPSFVDIESGWPE